MHGFHFYRHSWTPRTGQQLPTELGIDNPEDRFVVAVVDVIDGSHSTAFPENLVGYYLISWTTGRDHLCSHRTKDSIHSSHKEVLCSVRLRGHKNARTYVLGQRPPDDVYVINRAATMLFFCARATCGYYSRAATLRCAATIRVNTVFTIGAC